MWVQYLQGGMFENKICKNEWRSTYLQVSELAHK